MRLLFLRGVFSGFSNLNFLKLIAWGYQNVKKIEKHDQANKLNAVGGLDYPGFVNALQTAGGGKG